MKHYTYFIAFVVFITFQVIVSKEILSPNEETSKVLIGESPLSPHVEPSSRHNESEPTFRRTFGRTRLWTPVTTTTELPKMSSTIVPARNMSESEIVHEKWKDFEKNMKKIILGQMKKALPLFLRMGSDTNISAECSRGIMSLVQGVRGLKSWAFRSK